MQYLFLLIVTFKIIRKNFVKINEAMGFRGSYSNIQKVKSVLNAKEIENESLTTPNLIDHSSRLIASNYNSWVAEHPSALRSFHKMMKAAKGKSIVVFLDYDGTLSPIVDDPDRAFMSDEMRSAVSEVAQCFPTAIISGRSRDKVKEFVNLSNVYYAGSHGMDIMAPPKPIVSCHGKHPNLTNNSKENEVVFQPAKNFLPAIQEIITRLEDKIREIQGAKIEDNGFCVSIHFRHVRQEDYGILEEKVKSVLKNFPEFHLSDGKMVLEIKPSIEWNKGHALEYFLDTLGLSNSSNVLPLYIGDDRTDEDAFQAIQSRGQGYPIIVSSIPKETRASYSLHDPSEVLIFLLRLARWRKNYLNLSII